MKMMSVQLILLLLSNYSESSILTDQASYISNSEFVYRILTSVVWWRSDPEDVTDFLTKYQGSVKTINIDALMANETISFQQTILFITTYDEFVYFVNKMDTQIIIPSKAIVILTSPETDLVILNSITETAWKYDITDLIIMNFNNGSQTVEMHTYFPYRRGNGCGNTSAVRMDPMKGKLFPRKFNNFHGCELRYGGRPVFPYFMCTSSNQPPEANGGITRKFYTMIFERLNTNVNVICSPESKTERNDTLHKLIHKKLDVLNVFLDDEIYSKVISLVVLYFCEMTWFGPPQREIYAWAKVIFPMISNITALLGAAFLVFAVVLKAIHTIEPCKEKKKSPQIIRNTLAIFLGQEANYVSKSLLMNLLFLLWIWFSLIVSLIYQGELVRGLQTQHLEPRFGTLENAIKSLDGYGGSILMRNYQIGTPIYENYQVLPYEKVVSYISEIANGKRFLSCTDKLRVKGYKTLQFLDKSIIRLPIVLTVRPRWGAAVEFEALTIRAAESGFYEKLFRDLEVEITKQVVRSSSQQWSVQSLELVTLSTCFYGLAIMYLVCFIVLCIEIIHDWLLTPPILKGEFKTRNLNKSHLA